MADLGTIELGTYTSGSPSSNTDITGSDPILESISGADDADFVFDNSNTSHTGVGTFDLGDVPDDFDTILTVAIRLRYARAAIEDNNIWDALNVQIVESDGSTALTDDTEIVAGPIQNTTITNSSVITLTNPNQSATREDWEAALVLINFVIDRNKGGDTIEERVYAAEVTGTYTVKVVT